MGIVRTENKYRKNYKFTEKKHSVPGAVAGFIAIVPLLLFFYAVRASYRQGGNAQPEMGCIGILGMLIAILALAIAVREVRKTNVFKRVPVIALLLASLMLLGWCAVYLLGWWVML